jgi:hypothetical protein
MKLWTVAGVATALVVGGIAVGLAADDEGQAKEKDQDKAKVERELKDLEGQREKLNSKIRDLRRKLGRGEETRVFIDGNEPKVFKFDKNFGDWKGLSEEQRKEVEKAMEHAHKAVEEAMKNLPDMKKLIPDIDGIIEKSLKAVPDAESLHWDKLSPEEREKVKRSLDSAKEKMRMSREEMRKHMEEMRKNMPKMQEFRFNRGEGDPGLRKELEELRAEMRELREQMRRELGKDKSKPESGKSKGEAIELL